MRRALLALSTSLAIHVASVTVAMLAAASSGWPVVRGIEVHAVEVEAVTDLPLGPTAVRGQGDKHRLGSAKPRRRKSKPAANEGTALVSTPDAGADAFAAPLAHESDAGDEDQRPQRPGDLRRYGPEGSRVVALIRLDRLRSSPDAPALIRATDDVLRLLPDRRRLIDGTGLDLFRDFDVLLVATPNPFDDTVTFLATRHHLPERDLATALERGAEASGRPIVWREEHGRPLGIRAARATGEPGAPAHDRDERIFLLAQPGLAIMTPPAYVRLLLAGAAVRDADARDAGETTGGGGRLGASAGWGALVDRIDAESESVPDDAVLVVTASNLLRGRPFDAHGLTAEGPAPLPSVVSVILRATPTLSVELSAEFASADQAAAWERQWPAAQKQLVSNPWLILGGLSVLLARAELAREDNLIRVGVAATRAETPRILQLLSTLAQGGGHGR